MSPSEALRRLWERVPKGSLARGAAVTFAIKLVAMPCTLLLQLGMVRLLGVGPYGEFMYAFTWYLSLLPLATLGLQEAAVRFTAEYRAQRNEARFQGYVGWSSRVALLSGLVTALVGLALTWATRSQLTPTLFYAFVLAWVALPLGAVATVATATLRGLERFTAAQVPLQIVLPLSALALAAALVHLGGLPADAATGMLGYLGAVFLFFVTVHVLTRAATQGTGSAVAPEIHGREWLGASLHFLGLAVVALTTRVDVLMLGVLDGTVAAGIYATVVQLQLLVGFAFHILSFVVGPVISRLNTEESHDELQSVLRASAAIGTAIALPGFALLVLLGRPVLRLFDPSFDVGFEALVLLGITQVLLVVTGPVGRVLSMTGRHRVAFWFTGTGAALNVALNAALIPAFGMAGAAWATLLSMIVWRAGALLYVWRQLEIDPSLLSLVRGRR